VGVISMHIFSPCHNEKSYHNYSALHFRKQSLTSQWRRRITPMFLILLCGLARHFPPVCPLICYKFLIIFERHVNFLSLAPICLCAIVLRYHCSNPLFPSITHKTVLPLVLPLILPTPSPLSFPPPPVFVLCLPFTLIMY